MPRRTLKYRAPRNRDKYSVEQTGLYFTIPASDPVNGLYQAASLVVPTSATQGMRKVKHLTVSLTPTQTADIYWALVFVPEGYNPNALFPAGSVNGNPMYEPNQYVMNCGIVDPNAGPVRAALVSPAILIAVTVFTLSLDLQVALVFLCKVL